MVLLVKAFMVSEELAQVTEVCFPFVGLNYLTELPDSAKLLPRELLLLALRRFLGLRFVGTIAVRL